MKPYFTDKFFFISGRGHDLRHRHAGAGGVGLVARQTRLRRRLFPLRLCRDHRRQGAVKHHLSTRQEFRIS